MVALIAFGIGALWWLGLPAPFYAVSCIVPLLWAHAGSPADAGRILGYHFMASTFPMLSGMERYLDSVLASIGIWIFTALLSFAAGWLCWRQEHPERGLPLLFLLLSLPPLSLVAWPNPIILSGLIFPGLGMGSAIALLITIYFVAWLRHPGWSSAFGIFVVLFSFFGFAVFPEPESAEYVGLDTAFVETPVSHLEDFQRHQALIRLVADSDKTTVFPEGVAGTWGTAGCDLWRAAGAKAIVGARVNTEGGYHNALIEVTPAGCNIIYRQRLPIPIGMWRPWSAETAIPDWSMGESRFLICYETTQPWLVWWHGVGDLLVVAGDVSWAPPQILRAQRVIGKAWARAYNIPLVEAYNTPS